MQRRRVHPLAIAGAGSNTGRIVVGLNALPQATQHVPDTLRILLASGLLPVAFLAVVLNIVLPEEAEGAA